MPTCPFRMMAGMVLDGQRARLHAVGEGRPMPIDTNCIGTDCMLFNQTGVNERGNPMGGCAPAVGSTLLTQLNRKVDSILFAGIESIEEDFALHVGDPALNPKVAPSILDRFSMKIRKLFAPAKSEPAPEPPKPKPPLSPIDGGKDKLNHGDR